MEKPVYLHLLDRELLTTLNLYQTLNERLVKRDITLILLSTISQTYLSLSLVFENKFARDILFSMPDLFRFGYIEVLLNNYNDLISFVQRKRESYSHTKNNYSFYFDDTWKAIADLSPKINFQINNGSTKELAKKILVCPLDMGTQVNESENQIYDTNQIVKDVVANRKNLAITKVLYAPYFEKYNISDQLQYLYNRTISHYYIQAQMSFLEGTIATDLNVGLKPLDYLSVTHPHNSVGLWEKIFDYLGALNFILNASQIDILNIKQSPIHKIFITNTKSAISLCTKNINNSQVDLKILNTILINTLKKIDNKKKINTVDDLLERMEQFTLNCELGNDIKTKENKQHIQKRGGSVNKSIFIIHGHCPEDYLLLKQFLIDKEYTPVLLDEMPREGRTIIDMFEYYAEKCDYAIAILTPDDLIEDDMANKYSQARPNVIFELGWFCGRKKRSNTCIICKDNKNLKIFSDYSGVGYYSYTNNIEEIFYRLEKELETLT